VDTLSLRAKGSLRGCLDSSQLVVRCYARQCVSRLLRPTFMLFICYVFFFYLVGCFVIIFSLLCSFFFGESVQTMICLGNLKYHVVLFSPPMAIPRSLLPDSLFRSHGMSPFSFPSVRPLRARRGPLAPSPALPMDQSFPLVVLSPLLRSPP